MREIDPAADHRRPGTGELKAISASVTHWSTTLRRPSAVWPWCFQFLRPLPTHDRLRKHGLRAQASQDAARRDRRGRCARRPGGESATSNRCCGDGLWQPPAARDRGWPSVAPSCASPRCSFFDEPLSNLDAALRVRMRFEFVKLHQTSRLHPMIYVTHDQAEAMTLADRIVVLREGRVEQIGKPFDLSSPPGRKVRRRLHRLAEDQSVQR